MFPISKEVIFVSRTRSHIKIEVERLKAKGKTEEEIIHWIEEVLDKKIGLYNYFDTVGELAQYVNLPISKFNIVWI